MKHTVCCTVSIKIFLLKFLKIDTHLKINDVKKKQLNNRAPGGFGVVMKPALLPGTPQGSCRRILGRPR